VPDIRQLERFIAVAKERSFRRAAAQLHISQPPLSDAIRKLEEEIGTPLFLRDRHRVELTRAGEVFLGRAELLLSQLDDSVAEAQAVATGLSGQITVGFFPTATYDVLPRILRTFRDRHPEVGLRFAEITTPEQPEALRLKEIDVALFLAPMASVKGVAQQVFHTEPLIVAVPEDHRLAQRKDIGIADLREEPFVFIPPRWGTGLHAHVSSAFAEAGFAPKVVEEVQHLHTMVSLVAAGIGVAVGAASLRHFNPPGVVFRHLRMRSSSRHVEFGVAWRQDDASPAVARFLDIARKTGTLTKSRKRVA